MAESVKRLEEASVQTATRTADQQRDLDANLAHMKGQLGQMRRELTQLQTQETQFMNLVATEQNRWSDFNTRLDELERQLPVKQ